MATRAPNVIQLPVSAGTEVEPSCNLWLTAAELADLGLPGLSRIKRTINERAQAELWALRTDAKGQPLARKRAARGGGIEYHISLLPAAARAALIKRNSAAVEQNRSGGEANSIWTWFDGQSAKTKAEAQARLERIIDVDQLELAGMTRSSAVAAVCAQYGIGSSTMWSWLALIDGVAVENRLPHLAPQRRGGGKESSVDAEIFKFIQSDFLRQSKPSWESCYYRLQRKFAGVEGVTIPSSRTLKRKFERETPAQLIALQRGGAEALRKLMPFQRRSVAELHAMELVNIDGHDCDVFVRWPDGRIIRPTFLAIQDVYSRKFLAWRIAETEDSITARLVFADLFKNWGIPKGLLADNGHAFASKWLSGGIPNRYRFKVKHDEPTGLLTALGIEVVWALPYRGSSKPIERGFRDFCDHAAKHPAFEGAYTGNNTSNKPENYGDRAVPYDEFMRVWADCVAAHNAKPGRRTEMGAGLKSFDQVFAESYAASAIGKASPDQLKLALLTAAEKRCHAKSGEIKLYGNRYWVPEMLELAGKRVIVRFDPDDLHQRVYIYSRDSEFLLSADIISDVGFRDAEAAKLRARQIADVKKHTKAMAKSEGLLSAAQLADMMPDTPDEEAPEATIIRPVRHRGQTAASLKPRVQDAQNAVSNSVLDRIESHLRLVK